MNNPTDTGAWVVWGRLHDGIPIKLSEGTLDEARRYAGRMSNGSDDIRVRPAGAPFEPCGGVR